MIRILCRKTLPLVRASARPRSLGSVCKVSGARSMSGFASLSPRSLDEIVKRELISNEPADRMEEIWLQYHVESKSAAGFTLHADHQKVIADRMKESPMCIWPVFKSNSDEHFILLSQQQDTFVLCTYLEEYKRSPDTASPWLCVAVFDDFVETKKMALVRGDFTPNLNKAEGDLTSRLILHGYYDDAGYEFVRAFNKTPETFDYDAFMEFFRKAHADLVEDAEAREAVALAEDISGQVAA